MIEKERPIMNFLLYFRNKKGKQRNELTSNNITKKYNAIKIKKIYKKLNESNFFQKNSKKIYFSKIEISIFLV